MTATQQKSELSLGKTSGASPAEDRFYVIVFFDISEAKKYRALTKILKSYGNRIQKSVFEAQLRRAQIKNLIAAIEKLMTSERYYCATDNVRIYKIAGNCEVTVFGVYESNILEENIFV
jgi:CRISPR-associated protein Cas2